MASLSERIKHAWSAFNNKDPTVNDYGFGAPSYYYPPFISSYNSSFGIDNTTLVDSVYNRIAVDAAAVSIRHVLTNDDGEFEDYIKDPLDYCLRTEANIDQSSKAFFQDVIMSMFNEPSGCVAIVPTKTNGDPNVTDEFEIYAMRVGKILEWKPDEILVRVYHDADGQYYDLPFSKRSTAIILNPFYSVINKPNSTARRLAAKMKLQDSMEHDAAQRLNMVVTLPYAVKTDMKKAQAKKRLDDLHQQLSESPYGIVYTDAAEHITQLNRPLESGIQDSIEFLTNSFFSQMSMTEAILNGTASEEEMTNYYNRTVDPILTAVIDGMSRKFLSYDKRTIGKESIMYFRDPFKLLSVSNMADSSDKFTRNEILSTNDVRRKLGLRPDDNPKSDELINKNISHPENENQ